MKDEDLKRVRKINREKILIAITAIVVCTGTIMLGLSVLLKMTRLPTRFTAKMEKNFPKNCAFTYSNYGYAVLGLVLELKQQCF